VEKKSKASNHQATTSN